LLEALVRVRAEARENKLHYDGKGVYRGTTFQGGYTIRVTMRGGHTALAGKPVAVVLLSGQAAKRSGGQTLLRSDLAVKRHFNAYPDLNTSSNTPPPGGEIDLLAFCAASESDEGEDQHPAVTPHARHGAGAGADSGASSEAAHPLSRKRPLAPPAMPPFKHVAHHPPSDPELSQDSEAGAEPYAASEGDGEGGGEDAARRSESESLRARANDLVLLLAMLETEGRYEQAPQQTLSLITSLAIAWPPPWP
jgi:hypothetical protein